MEWIKAKTILTRANYGSSWYGITYNMNLYKGCSHGCIYCDSRSECYHIEEFEQVRAKENALAILEQELRRKKEKGVIGLGSMSDPYNPQEKKYELTRGALKLILKYGYGVAIDTKSDLILRDLDLLQEIAKQNDVIVKFTITTPDDILCKKIEPNVCVSSRRLLAIKKLHDHGIFVGVMLNPVLPFLTDKEEDIRTLIRLASDHGAKFIHSYFSMTLRDRQRDYYYCQLDQHFPQMREKYQRIYEKHYLCYPTNRKNLYTVFQNTCEEYHLLYRMEDIIKAYKKKGQKEEQLCFFE